MHVLIDITNGQAVARHESYTCLAALACIQYCNVDTIVLREGENKSFSPLDIMVLHSICTQLNVLPKSNAYTTVLKQAREVIESMDWLIFPFTEQQVIQQLATIPPGCVDPYAFNPGSELPLPLRRWHVQPQRNTARFNSSLWINFASGGVLAQATAVPLATISSTSTPGPLPAPRARVRATGLAGRVAKALGTPHARPKAGSSTGNVWDIADRISGENEGVDEKTVRKAIIKACEAAGINTSTASVQYGKWKSSFGTESFQ